jgi:hypothetical protein
MPSGWSAARLRERAQLEVEDRQRAAETERRKIEQRHHQRAATASNDTVASLRGEVAELGQAANEAVNAVLDRVETQAAEIEALRTRCAVLEGRLSDRNSRGTKNTGSKKAPETLPNFLTPRLSS